MDNAIYIALNRQAALFRKMDVVANNVANASTPGFKGETMVFEEFLVNDKDSFNKKIAFSHDVSTYSDYRDGAIAATGRDLDVALEGDGLFKVQTPEGIRYTRQGSFATNAENQIVTKNGHPVLGQDGQPLALQEEDINISISSDGTIRAGEFGEQRGQIGVVWFESAQELKREENGYYSTEQAELPSGARAIQGSIEQSNVNAITELTNMISVNRSVGGVSKFMSEMHDLQRRAMTAYTRSN